MTCDIEQSLTHNISLFILMEDPKSSKSLLVAAKLQATVWTVVVLSLNLQLNVKYYSGLGYALRN